MTDTPQAVRTHDVRIQYLSGDEIFAETHGLFELPEGGDIDAAAAALAEDSAYFNQRIPDLSYRVSIRPPDPDDPGPPPACARVKPVCSRCGSEELVRDACARWDEEKQCWSLASVYDCTTCEICGAESDDLARWMPATHVAAPVQFAMDIAAALGQPDLGMDAHFRQFCLEHFRGSDIAAAAAAWTSAPGKA